MGNCLHQGARLTILFIRYVIFSSYYESRCFYFPILICYCFNVIKTNIEIVLLLKKIKEFDWRMRRENKRAIQNSWHNIMKRVSYNDEWKLVEKNPWPVVTFRNKSGWMNRLLFNTYVLNLFDFHCPAFIILIWRRWYN